MKYGQVLLSPAPASAPTPAKMSFLHKFVVNMIAFPKKVTHQ